MTEEHILLVGGPEDGQKLMIKSEHLVTQIWFADSLYSRTKVRVPGRHDDPEGHARTAFTHEEADA